MFWQQILVLRHPLTCWTLPRALYPLWLLHRASYGPVLGDGSHTLCVALVAALKKLPVQAIAGGGMLLSTLTQRVVVLVKQISPRYKIPYLVHLRLKARVYELLSLFAPPNVGYRILW